MRAELRTAIDRVVTTTAIEAHCPSIAWGIVVDGVLVQSGACGALDDGRVPTADSIYRIASMTKSFTAAAILSLRDEGLLELDDPLSRHAPEFAALRAPTRDAATIRIRDLLTMSAGMANDDPWCDRHMDASAAELDRFIAEGILFAGSTGALFEYSNLGFGLLGRVAARVSGQSLQQLVQQRLLAPLAMHRTSWAVPRHADWAKPYRFESGVMVVEGQDVQGDGALAPMGGLWSTIADLARWIAFFDDAYPARDDADEGPLCRASRREMQELQRYAGMRTHSGRKDPTGYGYGLCVREDSKLGKVVAHSGGLPGYGSNMRWLSGGHAGRRLGVIALGNVTYAPMAGLTHAILDLLAEHDMVPTRQQEAPLLHAAIEQLMNLLEHWDDALADALFTDNVARDRSYALRRVDADLLRAECGGALRVHRVVANNATSGYVEIAHASATCARLNIQLAPIMPARIQLIERERD